MSYDPPDRRDTLVLDYTAEARATTRQVGRQRSQKPGICSRGCGFHVRDVDDPRPHAPRLAKPEELPPGYTRGMVDCVGNLIEEKSE